MVASVSWGLPAEEHDSLENGVNLLELIKVIEKISTVLKINFHGSKNQFSSPVTPTNFRASYACR